MLQSDMIQMPRITLWSGGQICLAIAISELETLTWTTIRRSAEDENAETRLGLS
jgi:hypothetical protein